jgi:hypothetical protein
MQLGEVWVMLLRFVAAAIADGTSSTSTPSWISFVPAAFGLLGTIVGGVITYYTTTVANRRKEEAEREEKRIALVRDVSLRFIQAMQKQHVESFKLQFSTVHMEAFQEISEQMEQGGDPAELIAAFDRALATPGNPRTQNPTTQLQRLQSIIEGIKGASGLSETTALLAEMRLLLPNHIIDIAAIVAMLSLMQEVISALPQGMEVGFPPGYKNAIVDVFTNAVRKEMGLNEYMPDEITFLNLFAKLKKFKADAEYTPDKFSNLMAKLEKLEGDAD